MDSVVEVPGKDLLPTQSLTAKLYLDVGPDTSELVRKNWSLLVSPGPKMFRRNPDWQLDYNSAFSPSVIILDAFAEFPYGVSPRDIRRSLETQEIPRASSATKVQTTFSEPRRFLAKISYANNGIVPRSERLNRIEFLKKIINKCYLGQTLLD